MFYLNSDQATTWLMVATVQTSGTPVIGLPTRLLNVTGYVTNWLHPFDVSADGQRFLVIKPEPAVDQSAATAHIVVALNQFNDRLTPRAR